MSPDPQDPPTPPQDDLAWDELMASAFGERDDPPSVIERLDRARAVAPPIAVPPQAGLVEPSLKTTAEAGLPVAGDRIGRHLILGELARGGMGIVYKAKDLDLGREVALKLLRPERSEDGDVLARFVEEAQISGQLQHPGIVPIYEMGVDSENRPWFAMKLIRGRTLSELLQGARKDEDKSLLLKAFLAVCETIAYAHARRVIHRDIKPSNVMVGSFGEVQIVDFGFAKVLGTNEGSGAPSPRDGERIKTVRTGPDSSASMSGAVLGTPAYMAPEQARGETDRLDARADVFSLGAILCEILTGAAPYGQGSATELMERARKGQLQAALEPEPGRNIDSELLDLARRCLSPDPAGRPHDASEIVRAILNWSERRSAREAEARADAKAAAIRARAERRARRLTLALATVVLAAVGLGSGFFFFQQIESFERTRAEDARAEASFGKVRAALALEDLEAARRELKAAITIIEGGSTSPHLQGVAAGLSQRAQILEAALSERAQALAQRAAEERRHQLLVERLRELQNAPFGETTSEEYAAAFEDYGLDFAAMGPSAIVRELEARAVGAPIEQIVQALDRWAGGVSFQLVRESEPMRHLFLTAQELDDDPWRRELRSAVYDQDRDELLQLAERADLTRIGSQSLRFLVDALYAANERSRALALLQLAIPTHVDDAGLHARLSRWVLDDPAAVATAHRHAAIAVALAPRDPAHHELLARVVAKAEGPAAAIASLEAALVLLPGSDRLRIEIVPYLRELQRLDEALAVLEDLLARDPRHPIALRELLLVHEARGDREAAAKVRRQREELFGRRRRGPGSPPPDTSASLDWARRPTDELFEDLGARVARGTATAEDEMRLAALLSCIGEHASAIERIRAARVRANTPDAAILSARIAGAAGDFQSAAAALDEAVELGARSVSVDLAIAELERAQRVSGLIQSDLSSAEVAALGWRDQLALGRILALFDRPAAAIERTTALFRESAREGSGRDERREPPGRGPGGPALGMGRSHGFGIGHWSGHEIFMTLARAGFGLGQDGTTSSEADRQRWRAEAQKALEGQLVWSRQVRRRLSGRDLLGGLQVLHWPSDRRLPEIWARAAALPAPEAAQWAALYDRVVEFQASIGREDGPLPGLAPPPPP